MTDAVSLVCIIPVHNDSAHIGTAIASLLAQTIPPTRIVIVDDGSTDAIGEALAPFAGKLEYRRQAQAGPAVARNLGASDAAEEYIAFLDSDDRYDPARFATALATMRGDPSIGGTACLAQNVDEAGTPIGDPLPAFTCGTLVVRRAAFERIGPFDAALPHGSAFDWQVRARQIGVRIALDEAVLMYRLLRATSLSATETGQNHKEHLQVLRAALARRRAEAG
jgi:glycosyltransferase involved in cell wall biosynthesis